MKKIPENHPMRNEAKRHTRRINATSLALSVFMPVVWVVLGAFSGLLWEGNQLAVSVGWAFAIAAHILFWMYSFPSDHSVLALTLENLDLKADNERALASLTAAESWVFQSVAAINLRAMTIAACRKGIKNFADLREALEDLLAPLHLQGGDIFGFQGSERWSFAVYLYSEADDVLKPVWREKSRNHPSDAVGRSWGRGQGHVGKAFVDAKAIITGDATHPDVVQLCGAPSQLLRKYDELVYRSFASIPIGPYDGEELPYGILVATSDHEDRFDEDNSLLLMHYADSIGTVIALGDLQMDEVWKTMPSDGGGNE